VEYISIIEDYFSGKLKDEELENFYLQLKKNSLLKEEFDAYREAHNFIVYQEDTLVEDLGKMVDFEFSPKVYLDIDKYKKPGSITDKEKILSDALSSIDLDSQDNSLARKLRNNWIKIAVVIVLFVLFTFTSILLCPLSTSNNELFAKYYSTYVASFQTRAIHKDENKLFNEALIFYKNRRFDLALDRFDLIPENKKPSCILFFQGICYIELKNYKKAIVTFDNINEHNGFYMTSVWYKGLCYIKINDNRNAILVFNKLKSCKSYKSRSEKILKALE
jgi:hypothetical protein